LHKHPIDIFIENLRNTEKIYVYKFVQLVLDEMFVRAIEETRKQFNVTQDISQILWTYKQMRGYDRTQPKGKIHFSKDITPELQLIITQIYQEFDMRQHLFVHIDYDEYSSGISITPDDPKRGIVRMGEAFRVNLMLTPQFLSTDIPLEDKRGVLLHELAGHRLNLDGILSGMLMAELKLENFEDTPLHRYAEYAADQLPAALNIANSQAALTTLADGKLCNEDEESRQQVKEMLENVKYVDEQVLDDIEKDCSHPLLARRIKCLKLINKLLIAELKYVKSLRTKK